MSHMVSALEDIGFLARSEHRTGVLAALAGGRRDRRDLRKRTGAPSATIGRILGDFEKPLLPFDETEITIQPDADVAEPTHETDE